MRTKVFLSAMIIVVIGVIQSDVKARTAKEASQCSPS